MDLYVLIACRSGSSTLADTLSSFARANLPSCFERLVIVENGPASELVDVVHALPGRLRAQYIYVADGSKTSALNAGINEIERGLIVFADDDIRFSADHLMAYVRAAERYGRDAYYGGPFDVAFSGPEPAPWLQEYLPISVTGFDGDPTQRAAPFTGFLGFNWAAFAEDIKAVGRFAETLGPGSPLNSVGDETELQGRLVDLGLTPIFVKDARVVHHVPEGVHEPAWIIDRRYRQGLWPGMMYHQNHAEESDLLPYPGWMLRYRFKLEVQRARKFFAGTRDQFAAAYELAWHRGFMHGFRYARTHY